MKKIIDRLEAMYNCSVEHTTDNGELVIYDSGTSKDCEKAKESAIQERLRIGRELRTLRESKGLTIRQVEAMTGISNPHITRIENGRHSTGIDIIAAIAAALGAKITII